MTKYIDYLKGREEVCLPEMQADIGVSYSEYSRDLSELRRWGYISLETRGTCAAVNSRYVSARDRVLDDAELGKLAASLSEDAVMLYEYLGDIYNLGDFSDPEYFRRSHEAMSFKDKRGLDELIKTGIMHEFEGCFYCSISYSSYMKLRTMLFFEDEDLITYVAHPLLLSLIDGEASEDEVRELLTLPLVPERARRFVEESFIEYKLTGKAPARRTPECKDYFRVKHDMKEAFLLNREFDTTKEYRIEAHSADMVIQNCAFAPKALRDGSKELMSYINSGTILRFKHDTRLIRLTAEKNRK